MMSFANYVSLPQLINCLLMLMFWNAWSTAIDIWCILVEFLGKPILTDWE